MAFFHRPRHDLGLLLAGLSNGIHGILHLVLVEQAEETPEAGTAAIFVLAFCVVATLVDARRAAGVLTQVRLRHAIAVHDRALTTLATSVSLGVLKLSWFLDGRLSS